MLHLCVPSAPVCLPLSPAPDPKASRALFSPPPSFCLTSCLSAITDLFCLSSSLYLSVSGLVSSPHSSPTHTPTLTCVLPLAP